MRSSFSLLAAVMTIFFAGAAQAQCAFDAPAKARGFKSVMVRAYSACPGVTFTAPNTATMAGVPACRWPVATSTYQFGAKGACSFGLSTRLKDPCPNPLFASCQQLKIRATCKDVVEAGGLTLIDGAASGNGWTVAITLRATTDDDINGDMTVIDFPMQLAFPTAERGKLKMKLGLLPCDGGDCGFFGPINLFPACSSLEILTVPINDPTGALFATIGSSTR